MMIYYIVKLEKSFYSFNQVPYKEKVMNTTNDIFQFIKHNFNNDIRYSYYSYFRLVVRTTLKDSQTKE